MNLFVLIKENVTARQVAEAYGLKVTPKGMACCPFHRDKTPSMKLDERYYCFGCGATGDAVDLTMQLLNLNSKDAAYRIANDLGIPVDEPEGSRRIETKATGPPKKKQAEDAKEWIDHAIKIVLDYLWLLRDFEKYDAPQNQEDDLDAHPLFCLALQQKSYIEYLADELMMCGKDQFEEMRNSCGKEVDKIEERLSRFIAGRKKEAGS